MERPVFLTSEDLEEVVERDRLNQNGLMAFWEAMQKGELKGVPTVN